MSRICVILWSLLLLIENAFAETEASGGSALSSILMLVAFFAIFYFLLIRPQMKRSKEQRKMISELAKGDEVVTTGGILGQIVKIGDNYIEIEISENVVVKMQKNSIASVLPKGSINTH